MNWGEVPYSPIQCWCVLGEKMLMILLLPSTHTCAHILGEKRERDLYEMCVCLCTCTCIGRGEII